MSHPVWVRGLKLSMLYHIMLINNVAPRVGAWIETRLASLLAKYPSLSHPVWVRGLKLLLLSRARNLRLVAPRVGAWIETQK